MSHPEDSSSPSRYRNPFPTVDVVIEIDGGIVLIERVNAPRGWALPGGFIDYGESPEDAARREVREETGLEVQLQHLLGVYGAPDRDPRQHNLSVVYVGDAVGRPSGGDDARAAEVFSLDNLPSNLCFDHARILADYREFKVTGTIPLPSPTRPLIAADLEGRLLREARLAIEVLLSVPAGTLPPIGEDEHPVLAAPGACFVTLKTSTGQLRGCVGEIQARRPLLQSVRACAQSAAFEDSRFSPLSADEWPDLQVAISILGPPRAIATSAEIKLGRDGIILEAEGRRAVFLPEVATEAGWDRETLLSKLEAKAALPVGTACSADARLFVFETQKF